MTKLNRALLLVLAIQVGVLVVIRISGGGPSKPPVRKLFEKLKTAEVTRLRVAGSDGKSVLLEKQGGTWTLASGGGFPALGNKVTELLGKLPGLRAGAPVTEKSDHHRALEVGKEGFQREITIEPGPGGKPLSFFLGSSAGIKDVHLRLADENAVYLVKDLSPWDASTAAADWISTEYFKADRDRIALLTLENSEGKLELKKEGGKWTVAGLAEEAKVKQSEIDSLLGTASAVSLQEPVGKAALPRHGLEKPTVTLTLEVEEKKGEEKKGEEKKGEEKTPPKLTRLVLRIGAKDGDGYFAKSEGSPFVVKLASFTVEPLLKKKAADFEEKKEEKKEGEKKDDDAPPMPPMPPPGDEP